MNFAHLQLVPLCRGQQFVTPPLKASESLCDLVVGAEVSVGCRARILDPGDLLLYCRGGPLVSSFNLTIYEFVVLGVPRSGSFKYALTN